jgi:two-component system sensor histidine kinase KdpD
VSAARRAVRGLAVIVVGVGIATAVVAILEQVAALPDASAVYLVAVVVSAMLSGTLAAVCTAVLAVLTYDLLFTAPQLTLHITDTGEWLSLVLLTFVGVTVGQLVALQRRRTGEALSREREALDQYVVSRSLASHRTTEDALEDTARILSQRAGLERVWFGLGESLGQERVVADTGSGPAPPVTTFSQLRRTAEGLPREWVTLHAPGRQRSAASPGRTRLRVVVEAGGAALGSLWGERQRSAPLPDPSTSRLLATAADQIGQAVQQDRLAARAAEARIAQASDALKSALVESVSHDLRLPLASIRAAAGPLIDSSVGLTWDDVHEAATTIDREAAGLDRLVATLLDLGRIQGGMLQAHREAVELGEAVGLARDRLAHRLPPGRAAAIEVAIGEAWVDADPVLLQQAVVNVLENAVRHTPPGTRVVVSSAPAAPISATGTTATARAVGLAGIEAPAGAIRLTIEDAGPGVPDEVLARLFERFFRVSTRRAAGRLGSGLGLAVSRGFVEAMGGHVTARPSALGGLAIDMVLPATVLPPGGAT